MQNKAKIYSVTEVNSLVKGALEASLPGRVTVKGEITGWKQHSSGHCYFSLKDEGSVLPCAMWKPSFAKVRFRPENGLAVLATGSVNVYVPQGRYSLVVEEMTPAGVGALQLAFEQMVKKLRAEGLFADEHKKPIPTYPERIGILTSESGAAVHDIADSVHNRWPCTRLYLYPVAVQGEGAAAQIAAAIGDVNRRNSKLKLDLLIVGRGGGSLEDLWAFNEEVLARAIFASTIPIISAVGHEVDVTVADLVADARASTPTKAGVAAVPDRRDVLADLAHEERRLAGNVRSRLDLGAEYLRTALASAVFRNPMLPIRMREQHVDELASGLADGMKGVLADGREALQGYYEQVARIEPHRLLGKVTVELNELKSRAQAGLTAALNGKRMELTAQENRLTALDPKSVLIRMREQHVDELASGLADGMKGVLADGREALQGYYEQVARIEPHRLLGKVTVELNELKSRAQAGLTAALNGKRMELTAQENRLTALDPKSVLKRGYSITISKDTGRVVRTLDDVDVGSDLVTELAGEDLIESKVTQKGPRS